MFGVTGVSQLNPLHIIEKLQNIWEVICKIKFHEKKRKEKKRKEKKRKEKKRKGKKKEKKRIEKYLLYFVHPEDGQASRNTL